MKLKIRQPELMCSAKINQLPSKLIYLISIKKENKDFLIPINVLRFIEPEIVQLSNLNINTLNFTRGFIFNNRYFITQVFNQSRLNDGLTEIQIPNIPI